MEDVRAVDGHHQALCKLPGYRCEPAPNGSIRREAVNRCACPYFHLRIYDWHPSLTRRDRDALPRFTVPGRGTPHTTRPPRPRAPNTAGWAQRDAVGEEGRRLVCTIIRGTLPFAAGNCRCWGCVTHTNCPPNSGDYHITQATASKRCSNKVNEANKDIRESGDIAE